MKEYLTRLSADEFDRLAAHTNLAEGREMARLVLVDGWAPPEVAAEYGVTRQRVELAVNVIRRVHERVVPARDYWVALHADVPVGLAEPLAQFLLGLKLSKQPAVDKLVMLRIERALRRAVDTLRGEGDE